MKKKIKEMTKGRMKERLVSRSKSVTAVYIVLCILVIFALVRSIMLGNFENAFICVLVLFLFFLLFFCFKQLLIVLPLAEIFVSQFHSPQERRKINARNPCGNCTCYIARSCLIHTAKFHRADFIFPIHAK